MGAVKFDDSTAGPNKLHKKLTSRHLTMIAIGGTIGTGLFVASANSLHNAGPVGSLLCYLFVGIIVFFVVTSLGEIATLLPISGSFNSYGARFVDPALGFAMSINYWLLWAFALPTEMIAASYVMSYWFPNVESWVFILVFIIVLFGANCIGVRIYGEIEFVLSIIKVIAIILFIIFGAIMMFVKKEGAHNLTNPDAGLFGADALKFVSAFGSTFFAYGGTELVGITAGEAKNPRKHVPKAINGTFYRVAIFYVLSMFIIGLWVSPNDPALNLSSAHPTSPFTIALKNTGVSCAADIMNAVILVAVLSAGNSSMYAASRTLMALAAEKQAPQIFAYCTASGVPIVALIVSVVIGAMSLLGKFFGNGVVFDFLLDMTTLNIVLTWLFICVTHLRFRKAYVAQGYKLNDLPYKAPFFPYAQYIAIFFITCILILEGITTGMTGKGDTKTPVKLSGMYVAVVIFAFCYGGYKIINKTKFVDPLDADLVSNNSNLLSAATNSVSKEFEANQEIIVEENEKNA